MGVNSWGIGPIALVHLELVGCYPAQQNQGGAPYLRVELMRGSVDFTQHSQIIIWLILPVVICLSQRLSHACLSINNNTVKLRMAH